jgi:hypothetical protein
MLKIEKMNVSVFISCIFFILQQLHKKIFLQEMVVIHHLSPLSQLSGAAAVYNCLEALWRLQPHPAMQHRLGVPPTGGV